MLILASASQSRKNLLANSDIQFIQIASKFDESLIKEENILKLSLQLSLSKAEHVLEILRGKYFSQILDFPNIEILGCDSLFELKGKAYGKPINKDEAFNRWKIMNSSYGHLHTGHTILFCEVDKNKKEIIFKKEQKNVISSKVYFSKLKDEEISKYVESLDPLMAAGGFTLEGRGGKYIDKIDGCFSNVMGLSLPWLRKTLLKKGIYI